MAGQIYIIYVTGNVAETISRGPRRSTVMSSAALGHIRHIALNNKRRK